MPDLYSIKLPNNITYEIKDSSGLNQVNCSAFHNSFFRGYDLGSSISDTQYSYISSGSFDDMFIGDYWNTSVGKYTIAAFDYFLGVGDTSDSSHITSSHHVLLIYSGLDDSFANTSASVSIGYGGMKSLTSAGTIGKTFASYWLNVNPFPTSHVLSWYDSYPNAVTNGAPSAGQWYESRIDLMTEQQVFGGKIISPVNTGTTTIWNYTLSNKQLPLFRLAPYLIPKDCILRDVYNASRMCWIDTAGRPNSIGAHTAKGICVYVGIK